MEIASIVIALVALFFAYRATMISSRALAISRAARREVLQREPAPPEAGPRPGAHLSASVEPGANPDVGDDGTIWVTGYDVLANLIVTVTNDGDRPSGRTEVDVWLPRAEAGDPWWTELDGDAPMPGMPQAVPDANVHLSLGSGAPTYEAVRLSRVLDRVEAGAQERLPIRAHFAVDPGRNEFPVAVALRGEDADGEGQHRAVVRIARRY